MLPLRKTIIEEFSTHDDVWAKQFIENPLGFSEKIMQNKTLATVETF